LRGITTPRIETKIRPLLDKVFSFIVYIVQFISLKPQTCHFYLASLILLQIGEKHIKVSAAEAIPFFYKFNFSGYYQQHLVSLIIEKKENKQTQYSFQQSMKTKWLLAWENNNF